MRYKLCFITLTIALTPRQDHDLDTYKALKKEIKEWSVTVSQKKNPEWLILQIVTPDQAKQGRSNAFSFGGTTVYEKLKADFATPDKRNRCAKFLSGW